MKGMSQLKKEFWPCSLIKRKRAVSTADKKVGTDSPERVAVSSQHPAFSLKFFLAS
jgi:hypothetical protein